ncbi:hypothetical protein CAPTEDRAFT_196236 [Capitella teleta]|uniref:Uncharacterized protein n=1 Tax=Capitella teleta TaxID=283909 RepID=R7T4L3_CAPTE|nr:hypothetical protein CAPTEDRAFT_196236 [Capitella teleta]|eukprot:ELT87987.1 hypothetical protein CAPTEDRAFT_196236 [Capitella teleta]
MQKIGAFQHFIGKVQCHLTFSFRHAPWVGVNASSGQLVYSTEAWLTGAFSAELFCSIGVSMMIPGRARQVTGVHVDMRHNTTIIVQTGWGVTIPARSPRKCPSWVLCVFVSTLSAMV